jgi:hypothetical protein
MGNIKSKDVGNFQEDVGKVSGNIGVIISTVFGALMIIIAIGFAITAFIPMEIDSTKDSGFKCNDSRPCLGGEECVNNKCIQRHKGTKKKHYWFFIISVVLIIIAIFWMWFSRWWRNYVYHNRTAAIIGGTGMEIGMLQNLFGR